MMKLLLLIFFLIFNVRISAQIFNNKLEESVYSSTKYILSMEYQNLIKTKSSLEQIDLIYLNSRSFNDNDISETLLSMTFSCLAFKSIPLSIPFLNDTLRIPLPSVSDSLFYLRRNLLPSNALFESNRQTGDDKDKLSHFFGSAFLSYNDNIFNISKFIGILVELFEYSFKIDGAIDYRDMIANRLGRLFGDLLNENRNLLPSDILGFYNYLNLQIILSY